MSDTGRTALGAGQIVYAHHLHLNSIDLSRHCKPIDHPSNKHRFTYTVKGSTRPMLIIGPNRGRIHGVQWYWVLVLTSVDGKPEKAKYPHLVRLGDLLGEGRESYTEDRPYSYPENLFEKEVKQVLDRGALQSVLSVVKIPFP